MITATLSSREILFGDAPIEERRQAFLACKEDMDGDVLSAAFAHGGTSKHITVDGAAGAASCGSPHAARVALDLMESGGNAADAAAAAALAMMVVDPPNCSPAGRAHILYATDDGAAAAVDGATRIPLALTPETPVPQPVPLPGAMRAIAAFQARAGRLPFAAVAEPARDLAKHGFTVPEELAAIWTWRAPLLVDNDAKIRYLPGGRAPQAGQMFAHDGLARYFDAAIDAGGDPFGDARFAHSFCAGIRSKGIHWPVDELLSADPLPGEVVTASGGDWTLRTIGKQGWGHTLAQILLMVSNAAPGLKSERDRILVKLLAVLRAFNDRPQELRSLKPKSDPIPWDDLLDRVGNPGVREWNDILAVIDFDTGAFDVSAVSRYIAAQTPPVAGTADEERDTTHLSVVDSGGMRVALTQSIGPHFGARVADPEFGILLAHSYRMEAAPGAGQRDVTEQCPSLLDIGEWQYAIGAAGSERIPGAVAAVAAALIAGDDLATAMARPRANWIGETVRLHVDIAEGLGALLQSAGVRFEFTDRGPIDHLGIVHAAGRRKDGLLTAAADAAYAGCALAG